MDEDWSVVTGLFAYGIDAGQAIHALESRGFDERETSIVMSEELEELFRLENRIPGTRASLYDSLLTRLVNGLTAVGPVAEGGRGVAAAGAILHALAGHGPDDGADIRTALMGYGVPAEEVRTLPREIELGKVLVTVRCANQSRESTADRALRIAGAERTVRA